MGIGNIGVPGMILILVVALIVFGPAKLPEIGRAVGHTLNEFKKATKGIIEGEPESPSEEEKEQ